MDCFTAYAITMFFHVNSVEAVEALLPWNLRIPEILGKTEPRVSGVDGALTQSEIMVSRGNPV